MAYKYYFEDKGYQVFDYAEFCKMKVETSQEKKKPYGKKN
jgi:hypothetical protein